MKITLAQAMGTCFGVQDAIDLALDPEFKDRLTVVGQLVHNPQTTARLRANGVRIIERDQIDSITTAAVMVTAHGASDATKEQLRSRGFIVGSPPPMREATVISLMSRVKILPRFASWRPLRCWMFAHLLWPAIWVS